MRPKAKRILSAFLRPPPSPFHPEYRPLRRFVRAHPGEGAYIRRVGWMEPPMVGTGERPMQHRRPASQTAVELKGVTREYRLGKTLIPALRSVDVEFQRGEFTVVAGPSGSGK